MYEIRSASFANYYLFQSDNANPNRLVRKAVIINFHAKLVLVLAKVV